MNKIISLFLIILLVLSFVSCKKAPETISSSNDSAPIQSEETISEIIDMDEESQTSHTSEKATSSENSTPKKSPNSSQTSSEEKEPSSSSIPNNSTTATSSYESSTEPTIVQRADPETGISWDGVSPIIYTYPDGTTGTEKKEGATYEYLPGMINTITVIRDGGGREFDSICPTCGRKVRAGSDGCWYYNYSHYCNDCGVLVSDMTCHYCSNLNNNSQYCRYCGKKSGFGANGTCLRYWASGNYECVSCGEAFPANTCHTCTKGCRYCGKAMGNGINGTCYRDYFGTSNCPSCGVSVPMNTCHTCG